MLAHQCLKFLLIWMKNSRMIQTL
uniref:Uncharacterized protein n=1 Tax=Rhizophora mucronata TaxID=61149 RepID=A0A2P2P485_RHIMU